MKKNYEAIVELIRIPTKDIDSQTCLRCCSFVVALAVTQSRLPCSVGWSITGSCTDSVRSDIVAGEQKQRTSE